MAAAVYHLHEEGVAPARQQRTIGVAVVFASAASALFGFMVGGHMSPATSSAPEPLVLCSSTPPPSKHHHSSDVGVLARCSHTVPIKKAVCGMDHSLVGLGEHWRNYTLFASAMKPFWTDDFTYTPMYGIGASTGLRAWFDNEMVTWTDAFPWVEFNQMIFVGSGPNASTTTYAVGDWQNALGLLAPSRKRMTVRITDFYRTADDGRIAHNWMMIDQLDLLRQQGMHPLPLSPLPQGRVSPPQGEGIPAPLERYVSAADAAEARAVVAAMLDAEWVGSSQSLTQWADSFVWYGPVPFGMAATAEQYTTHFLAPMQRALASRSLTTDVFACEGHFCAVRGRLSGVHVAEWLSVPPSGLTLTLDVGMHFRVDGGRILESWAVFDLPAMLLPIGIDLLRDTTGSAMPPRRTEGSAAATVGAAAKASAAPAAADAVSAVVGAVSAYADTDNACSNAYTVPPPSATSSADFDCPAFVIASTDATWHTRDWEATSRAVDTYFSEDWQSVRAFGLMLKGREALRAFMKDWLGGFPDVFIHVADVFCEGNVEVGYKTTMPYVLTATHSGWSKAFGAPSGKPVKYHGIANCYIKQIRGQWQYTREWDLPDMWAFISAMNISADRLPHPPGDLVPVDQCKPLFEWGTGEMNWFPGGGELRR